MPTRSTSQPSGRLTVAAGSPHRRPTPRSSRQAQPSPSSWSSPQGSQSRIASQLENGDFDGNGNVASWFQSIGWRRVKSPKSYRFGQRKRIATSTGSTTISNVRVAPPAARTLPPETGLLSVIVTTAGSATGYRCIAGGDCPPKRIQNLFRLIGQPPHKGTTYYGSAVEVTTWP
jgi:hypothetical protein